MSLLNTHQRPPRSVGDYLRHALVHPIHGCALLIPAAFLVLGFHCVLALVALLVVEMVVLGVLPHAPPFRRRIDAHVREKQRAHAASERAALLTQLSDFHRQDLADLERITNALRASSDPDRSDDWVGLEQLLELYVRLALAHSRVFKALRSTERVPTEDEVHRLGNQVSHAPEGKARQSAMRRVLMVRRRALARREAGEELLALEQDLATIGEVLRWMELHCASAGTDALRAELELVLASARRDGETLRDLCVLAESSPKLEILIENGRDNPEPCAVRVAVPPPPAPAVPLDEELDGSPTELVRLGAVVGVRL